MKRLAYATLSIVFILNIFNFKYTVAADKLVITDFSAVSQELYIYNYSGSYDEYDYNESTNDFNPKYFRYYVDVSDFEYTVTYNGNGKFVGSAYEIYDMFGEYPTCSTVQGYYNQWNIGSNDVLLSFAGMEKTVSVEVINTPIESIEVILKKEKLAKDTDLSCMDKAMAENFGGWNSYYYYNNEFLFVPGFGVAPFQSERDFIFYYDIPRFVDKVVLNFKEEYKDFYKDKNIEYTISTDQKMDTPWDEGTHTFTVSAYGYEQNFNIEIENSENPVVSVEVKEPVILYQYSNGDFDDHRLFDNCAISTWDYFKYYLPNDFDITVTYKDGTQKVGNISELYEETGCYAGIATNQGSDSYDTATFNIWDVGEHTATLFFAGLKADFKVDLLSLPITDFQLVEPINSNNYGDTKIIITFNDNSKECINLKNTYSKKLQKMLGVTSSFGYYSIDDPIVRIGNITRTSYINSTGDCDANGIVDTVDLSYTKLALANSLETLEIYVDEAVDLNNDKIVDTVDLAFLKLKLVGTTS